MSFKVSYISTFLGLLGVNFVLELQFDYGSFFKSVSKDWLGMIDKSFNSTYESLGM